MSWLKGLHEEGREGKRKDWKKEVDADECCRDGSGDEDDVA
jgi:hypothetical protein